MDEKPDEPLDRYAAETARVLAVLRDLVKAKPASVRSLEQKMRVGDSIFSKLLKGKITLQFRHILLLCDALDLDWRDFFALAYSLPGEPTDALLRSRIEPILEYLLIKRGLQLPPGPQPPPSEPPPSEPPPEEPPSDDE